VVFLQYLRSNQTFKAKVDLICKCLKGRADKDNGRGDFKKLTEMKRKDSNVGVIIVTVMDLNCSYITKQFFKPHFLFTDSFCFS